MIPLRDDQPSGSFPVFTVLLILANVSVFLHEIGQPLQAQNATIAQWSLIPARVQHLVHSREADWRAIFLPFLTSLFLHGGWMHLLGNMWYLWIFGDNVEDRLGHFRFLLFYLLCGVIAGGVHTVTHFSSAMPCVGASGAIAGVLGAYFLCYPGARILTLVPIFFFITFIRLPAFFVLGGWFLLQAFTATSPSIANSAAQGGVAWWAHIGGFIAGMFLLFFFPKNKKSRQQAYRVWYENRRP